ASCAKVGTGFAQKTMRQQKPGANCVIHKSRSLLQGCASGGMLETASGPEDGPSVPEGSF
ncbi:MAG: hypothetical protein LBV50_01995, partial [Novosphingobium sp.]|nr:hypothetical protein [Novosphingobium sp.]